MPSEAWRRHFSVQTSDIEYLTNLLLEKETPLTSRQLALALIQRWLDKQTARLEERYKDTRVYNPADSYEVGQRLLFPALGNAIGVVTAVRDGENPDYGEFKVITVELEDDDLNVEKEFAAELKTEHKLIQAAENGSSPLTQFADLEPEALLASDEERIIQSLEELLEEDGNLIRLAGTWFPKDLLIEIDLGTLHLAEAVLDLAGGGPLTTIEILKEIGMYEASAEALQVFSLNYAMAHDDRFDEVGPAGIVLWYLKRMEPEAVQSTPEFLQYTPIDYDRELLTPEMLELEAEIADEYSPLNGDDAPIEEATITLIYPHRITGTLPLNIHTQKIFPTAHTPRVWVTLVDGQDGETYTGWVVHGDRYIYGLQEYYKKHRLPIGAYLKVRKGDKPGHFVIDFNAYNPHREWLNVITANTEQIHLENDRRMIGGEYDDLITFGVDNLEALHQLRNTIRQQKRPLTSILKEIAASLRQLTPQGTVHVKTLYSIANVFYRCPPGPIMAILVANPAFEEVGNHYWQLTERD